MFLTADQKIIITRLCRRYLISRCILFGSYATGKATAASDVDLIVNDFPNFENLAYRLRDDLRYALKMPVDLVVIGAPSIVYDLGRHEILL